MQGLGQPISRAGLVDWWRWHGVLFGQAAPIPTDSGEEESDGSLKTDMEHRVKEIERWL